MKYEINYDQLKEMLKLQSECCDALDKLSDIGIELEGMKLRIPQNYALLNLVLDILGIQMDGFVRFEKDNPKLNTTNLCKHFSKQMKNQPYSFSRDNLISECLKYLSTNRFDECLKFIIESASEQQNNKK